MRENLHVHYSAEDYDRYTRRSVEAYDDRLIRRVVIERRVLRCRRLVDIGTGTGQVLIKMAAHRKLHDLQLIGIDYFPDMVAVARENVRLHGLEQRIAIEQADVHALPFADGSVDLAVSRSTIHHWADPVQAFREIGRILRPRGVAILHEPRRDPHPEALAEFNRRREQIGIEPARMDEKYTPGEVRSLLAQAGLRRHSIVVAPRRGPGALGFEVRISKSNPVETTAVRCIAKLVCLVRSW